MGNSISDFREREWEDSILENGREREFPRTPEKCQGMLPPQTNGNILVYSNCEFVHACQHRKVLFTSSHTHANVNIFFAS